MIVNALFSLITIAANLPCLMGSCPNLLRPACPYTGCRPSSFAGSMPHGVYSCQLQLLFFILYIWIVTNPAASFMALAKPVDAGTMFGFLPVSHVDAVFCNAIVNGFLFLPQNPGRCLH